MTPVLISLGMLLVYLALRLVVSKSIEQRLEKERIQNAVHGNFAIRPIVNQYLARFFLIDTPLTIALLYWLPTRYMLALLPILLILRGIQTLLVVRLFGHKAPSLASTLKESYLEVIPILGLAFGVLLFTLRAS